MADAKIDNVDNGGKAEHSAGKASYPSAILEVNARRHKEEIKETLQRHQSKLPTFFYLLSFAPPVPSLIRSPREFALHPYVQYTIGVSAAITAGFAGFPVLDLLYGLYWSNRITGDASPEEIKSASNFAGIIAICTAIATLIFTWIFQTCFSLASSALTLRMRHAYVASVLAQDASYFDGHGAGEVATHAGKEINLVRTAFGEKMGFAIWTSTIVVASLIAGFSVAAKVTGFLFSVVPLVVIMFVILSWASEAIGAPSLRLDGRASSYVEEIVGSMRIVQSFGMAPALLKKFDQDMLRKLERFGRRKALIRGMEAGAVYFALFVTYSAAFWFIGFQLVKGGIELGNGLTSFWNLINSLFAFASAVPHIAAIVEAMSALRLLRAAIEREPKIDIRSDKGRTIPEEDIKPEFVLEDVTLAYPSRPSMPSLRNVSLTLKEGKMTGIVGQSGSGKSTITSLLLREYDPETANVMTQADKAELEMEQEQDRKADAKEEKKKRKEERRGLAAGEGANDEKMPSVRAALSVFNRKGKRDASPASRMERASSDLSAPRDEKGKPKEDPEVQGGGRVYFSGVDVRELNVRWLRSQIAIVRQNPQIFTATVFENVAAGLSGTQWSYRPDEDDDPNAPDEIKERTKVIREKVRTALEKAQAWDFVQKLPEGIDTPISGGKTGLLSGGQRQRLSLARAIVREPRVLVIDEGTSAIDTNTEDKIRVMLEEEFKARGMTTVLIAHRLSTVEHADSIIVMKQGKYVDEGSHEELMRPDHKDHTYRSMVHHQRAIMKGDDDGEQSEEESAGSGTQSTSSSISPPRNDLATPFATPGERDPMSAETQSRSVDTKVESSPDSKAKMEKRMTKSRDPSSTLLPLQSEYNMPIEGRPQRPRRHSRATDHNVWKVAGRSVNIHQLADAAGSSANKVDIHRIAKMNSNEQSNAEGAVSALGGRPSLESRATTLSVHSKAADEPELPSRHLWKNFGRTFNRHRLDFSLGIFGAILAGAVFPIVGWITGKAVDALDARTPSLVTSQTHIWSLVFLCISVADFALILAQSYYLETASERMSRTLKHSALDALMRQEIGFFDREEAQSGALASNVASYPASVAAATGLVASQIIIALANLVGSVILGFILNWRAAFVTLSPVVILFFSGWLNVAMLERYERSLHEPASRAASFISENVDAIKEVTALGRERETLRIFDLMVVTKAPHQMRYLLLGGGGFSVSQAAVFGTAALIFYYGGNLRADGSLSVSAVYAIFEAAIIAIFAGGRVFTFTGDIGRAIAAFRALCGWYERRPQVDAVPPAQRIEKKDGWTKDDIVFSGVELRYPRRPDHPAIRDLNLTLRAGQHQAFCGTSGSGKSTILQMVQRFYDPYRGTINVGDVDIRAIAIDDLRDAMSYVSQDACLYEGTIRFNLLLGAAHGQEVSDEELEAVCEDACIADFIHGLPKGYDTDIGSKGTQLSGGQRQRICIARALVKKPQILLLDEATSALDAQAEVSVQKALDNASKGRTTLTVAHRLSTIRGADVIHVVEDGAIVESGTHDELIAKKGRYLELVQAQL